MDTYAADFCRAVALTTLLVIPFFTSGGCDGGPSSPDQSEPVQLAFHTQPADVPRGVVAPAVEVVFQDESGNVVPSATGKITLALGQSPGGASLSGTTTVSASGGVATFDDLSFDRAGTYTLSAFTQSLPVVTSDSFEVLFSFDGLSAGAFHTCGVARKNAYCWGWNQFGQLGNGTEEDASTPITVTGDLTFAAVDLGFDHTCGVPSTGTARCWGENGNGQIGDGTTLRRREPTAVVDGLGFEQVSAGTGHSCGVKSAGQAYCWGDNDSGQLGDGSTDSNSQTPVAVAGDVLFTTVSAGRDYTCGIADDGSAYCWGLLVGTTESSQTPVAVAGDLTFSQLSAGRSHACGITSDGDTYCWGNNSAGQLGDGSNDASATPVAVSGALTFTALSAGRSHTCAVAAGGALYCWGDNGEGQLGVSEAGGSSNVPITVAGDVTFAAVSAGNGHTCGLDADGLAYCWGNNDNGQVGDGSQETRLVPTRVSDPP